MISLKSTLKGCHKYNSKIAILEESMTSNWDLGTEEKQKAVRK